MDRSFRHPTPRRFHHKFRDAFRGLRIGMWGQSSFLVHAAASAAVLLAAWSLRVTVVEWILLVLCITRVWVAELIDTAIEHLCRAVTDEYQPDIGKALDVASAAVLVAAIGAAVVGLAVFGYRFGVYLGLWPVDFLT